MREVGKLAEKLAGCTGKLQYPSFSAAQRVVKRQGGPVHVYRCEYCRSFHIGKKAGR
jgi:hypothetical protein